MVTAQAAGAPKAGGKACKTHLAKVFAAGDMRRSPSLVVRAIREGRQCARAVDEFLMGSSGLPRYTTLNCEWPETVGGQGFQEDDIQRGALPLRRAYNLS